MKRTIITTTEVVATSLVLLCAGAQAAFAFPKELGPDYAPPTDPGVGTTSGIDFATQLRWMLTGAGVVLALAAAVLVAVLWHRAHAHAQSQRFVTS
jgi:hypothetical protein